MTSIMTNSSAMAALSTLRNINMQLEKTQGHISSGYRVETAADNAAYWSIATTMRSDKSAMSTVQDALGLASAKTDTAYTGLNSAIDVVTQIKTKLVAAREPGVDKTKVNAEITELKNQLISISESASFNGQNWLYNTDSTANGTVQMVGSFKRDDQGNVSVGVLSFDTSKSTLIDTNDVSKGVLTADTTVTYTDGTSTATGTFFLLDGGAATGASGTEVSLSSSTTNSDLDGMIAGVEKILTTMTDAAATLGATNSRISMQSDFVNTLMDSIDKGVGKLVDADMNQESTRLKALQTQQQLGIQALSIANSNSDSILQLFR